MFVRLGFYKPDKKDFENILDEEQKQNLPFHSLSSKISVIFVRFKCNDIMFKLVDFAKLLIFFSHLSYQLSKVSFEFEDRGRFLKPKI